MSSNRIEGNLKELRDRAKLKWSKLTDDDLDEIKDDRKKLADKIQYRYDKTQLEAETEVNDFEKGH
ncbi:CsbD family protein [Pseudoalteromonas carrageenovora]|uniref:CsbD family protein n=1 Tax=Pseudoalteromonas carrageenovora TaxID=227 RepID=UPI00311EDF4E